MDTIEQMNQQIERLRKSYDGATDVGRYEIDDAIDLVQTRIDRQRTRRRREGAKASQRCWQGLAGAMERAGMAVPDYVVEAADRAERRQNITGPRR